MIKLSKRKPSPKRKAPDSLSSKLLQAQDEERRRISRDLHDTVGQSLSAIKMTLDLLAREVGYHNHLGECLSMVEQTMTEVRTISYLLHPPTLDLFGLRSAIEAYAEGFAIRSGIQLDIVVPQELGRLVAECETTLFRILQECLTNIHRHTKASRVQIRLHDTHDQVKLVVEDNGQGIKPQRLADLSSCQATAGVGMMGMRERLRQFGGNLEIESSKRGTKISATLPISGRRLIDTETNPSSTTVVQPKTASNRR